MNFPRFEKRKKKIDNINLQIKKSNTPETVITAPTISFQLTRSLKRKTAGGMISTGTMAMMVAATPARVC